MPEETVICDHKDTETQRLGLAIFCLECGARMSFISKDQAEKLIEDSLILDAINMGGE